MEFTRDNPLPMRIPATHPPVPGDHMDIRVWPGGWRFAEARDQLRFNRLPTEGVASQAVFREVFDGQARALAER